MTYEKPDGVIEIGSSACCCPPGQRKGGQHTNACTDWYRINGQDWQPIRTRLTSTRILAGAAETVAEFAEALKQEL